MTDAKRYIWVTYAITYLECYRYFKKVEGFYLELIRDI